MPRDICKAGQPAWKAAVWFNDYSLGDPGFQALIPATNDFSVFLWAGASTEGSGNGMCFRKTTAKPDGASAMTSTGSARKLAVMRMADLDLR